MGATMADMVTITARGLLRRSLAMATTDTAMAMDTVTATMVDTVIIMERGLPTLRPLLRLRLSPAMATTATAMVMDTVMATMADTVTTMARGLLRLPLPLFPRLMLSPAMGTTATDTVTETVMATMADMVTITARGLLSPATATTDMVTDTVITAMVMDTAMVMVTMVRRFTFSLPPPCKYTMSRIQSLKGFIQI